MARKQLSLVLGLFAAIALGGYCLLAILTVALSGVDSSHSDEQVQAHLRNMILGIGVSLAVGTICGMRLTARCNDPRLAGGRADSQDRRKRPRVVTQT
jgi:hypothetical protein